MPTYEMYCTRCRKTVSTASPAGAACDCGRVQADWMRANLQTLAQRVSRKYSHVKKL